ncbi:hypothetical protein ACHAWF_011499 [Thalassiosira exigua]
MPVCSARVSSRNIPVCEAKVASSDGRWQKINCGLYLLATIPYVVEGIIFEGWWQVDPTWFGIGSSLLFLINSLYDLWLSVGLRNDDARSSNQAIDDGGPTSILTDRLPISKGKLRAADFYVFGSILYFVAMLMYTVASVSYYEFNRDMLALWVTAAVIFVVHSIACLAGTLISNAEPGARKTCILFGVKRWQDLDWYLWGDITFIAAAIFDVVSNYCLPNSGTFISAGNWLINALIYTAGAYAHDVKKEMLAPAIEIRGEKHIAPLVKDPESNHAVHKSNYGTLLLDRMPQPAGFLNNRQNPR